MKKKDENKKNKNVEKKVARKENKNDRVKTGTNYKNIIRVIVWVLVVFGLFYLLTFILVGDYGTKKKDDNVETVIQYDEILGGSSFSMNASKYLVVYYDSSEEDAADISSAIYNYEYSNSEPLRVYTVDLSNPLNKGIIAEDKSNKDPENASELAIKGTTLIRFRDGDVREYIEGTDKVLKYLEN